MVAFKKSFAINYVIGTGLFVVAPLIFEGSRSGLPWAGHLFFSYAYWIFILYYLGIYVVLERVIIPHLYLKRKFIGLSAVLLLLLASAVYIRPFDRLIHHSEKSTRQEKFREGPPPGQRNPAGGAQRPDTGRGHGPAVDIISIFLLFIVFLIVIADNALRRSRMTEQRAIQAEADRAQAELSFFKAQINPHFLFNTLNNIYSLAVTKNENTAGAVIKLSNIMRYITDEGNETMVPLQDEIDCINDYISLQKLRLGENFAIDFSVTGDTNTKTIPPLVLMTFIENAFKHGVSNHDLSSIDINIDARDESIHFVASNKLFTIPRSAERTGIGIENTKKRLQVLYPGKHVLKITGEDGLYAVELILYTQTAI